MWIRVRRLTPLLSLLLLAGALWLVHRELAAHHPRDILRNIRALPTEAVFWALALTVASYAVLTLYDRLGLRYVGRQLGAARTMLVGFLAYAFSQTLGFALLTGGSLRYRLYSAWGLSAAEIAQVIGVAGATLWLGVTTLGGVALIGFPASTLEATPVPPAVAQAIGVALLAVPAVYLGLTLRQRGTLTVWGWSIRVPSVRFAAGQILLGSVDWLLAATVAYALLPAGTAVSFVPFVGIFLLAQITGLISHVPGGVGVFESVVLVLLRGQAPPAAILGSLLVYRVIYYVVPFIAAAATLAAYELRERRKAVAAVARTAGAWLPALAPRALAAITFVAGTVLLISGALPAERGRLAFLNDLVPLSVIQLSHFFGSVAGVALLILAWGLARRLDAAFHLAAGFLGLGMVLSLLKGVDYEEAAVSGAALLVLLISRNRFDRRTSLVHEPFGVGWAVGVGTVVLAVTWLGLLAYRHVPYRDALWWDFALRGDAPRFLRATVGVLVGAGAFGLARLLRPARPVLAPPTAADLEAAAAIVATAPHTYVNLVFLRDKSLLFDDARTAFVMYGVSGNSWVAMGDPVGPEPVLADLVWRYRELVDDHGGYTVFYQVAPETLPLYLDLGLRPLKLGEEARVPLPGFSLEGGRRKGLRRTRRALEKEGCRFEVLAPPVVGAVLEELRAVSDTWLSQKATREKGFSLGRFDADYIARFPAAVVRREGAILAFANVWTAGAKSEIAPDLMRYRPDAPDGVMEYLFIELMQWGAAEGYTWFNLGMVPLAGMETRPLAPLWNRLNALVYRHGEHFYNFQGLRAYKEKFDPEWSPRYLAAPGGFALPRVIADVAALISGGLVGVATR